MHGEEILNHLGNRKGRVFEAEPDNLRVFVEQRDHFAGIVGKPSLGGGEQVKVRQDNDSALDSTTDRLAELLNHQGGQTGGLHPSALFATGSSRPSVQVQTGQADLTETIAQAHEEIGCDFLVAFNQNGEATLESIFRLCQLTDVSCFHRLLDG